MQATQANVMVDLQRMLDREHGGDLAIYLAGMPGVSRVRLSQRTGRLVLVDYDSERTDSRSILGAVVRRGFGARLVGL
jgi:hypothetical protein